MERGFLSKNGREKSTWKWGIWQLSSASWNFATRLANVTTTRLGNLVKSAATTFSNWWLPKTQTGGKITTTLGVEVKESKSAFKKFATQFTISSNQILNPKDFSKLISTEAERLLDENKETKVKAVLHCSMIRTNSAGEEEIHLADFHSDVETNLTADSSKDIFKAMFEVCLQNMAEFQKRRKQPEIPKSGKLRTTLCEI